MTEQDTFDALRRISFKEVHQRYRKFRTDLEDRGYEVLQGDAIKFFKEQGWDYFKYIDQLIGN
jgi:hypothetical protein